MAISDREKKYWEDKAAGRVFEGKDTSNPHRAQNTAIDVGDRLFGTILGNNNRMDREDAWDRGVRNAKKSN